MANNYDRDFQRALLASLFNTQTNIDKQVKEGSHGIVLMYKTFKEEGMTHEEALDLISAIMGGVRNEDN